ncbi:uncharacterized protein LOC129217535 [Uloborus diversus]|uniref:uncharacterized protein LOC129217535 n=1 Tax=Uloborus diversus TaxID=327109 RepID=UPI002409E570|nr:uncharacterized protein LOC129217535 [Uloborus diversus]
MRETARDRRFNVRLRDIQQIKTCARDDRIARETTRVDRFSVRSMDNRLMSRDVQDSRTARETTRKNRFSVRSTGIQQMVSNARVSRQARETTKLNRFLIRATDVQLIAKDVPEGKSRQKARMNHLSVHLTDKQRLITDLKGGQMTRVNDFVNLKGHRKILSGKNQDEVRVRNRSANQFTMNLNDIQTKILLWNGDVSLSRERSRSVSRLATHVMRLQSEIQGWKDSEIFVRRMETRIANSIPVDTRNFQQRMTIALKYNRVTRMQRTGRLYTLPETLRDLSRSAAVGGKDKNHFQTNAERATSQSSRKAWSKNTCESQNNRRQGRQIPLKNIARRRIVALNSISRANKNVDVFQGLDKTLLIRNKHHFRQLDSRAILKGDVLQIIRNRQQFRSHGDRLKKEFVRITPKDDKIYENADNKHTNNYSASGKTLIKTKNSEKDNTELSPFRNAEELKWVAEHRHTLKRNHRTFRSVGLDGKYNTGKMKFSRSVKLEIQDQNRRDFVRSTELPRFKNHRNRADIKEHFKSISSCDSEIKNKNYEANRRTLTQSRRNNEHKKRENELLGDSGHSSDIDVRKLNSHRSLTVRTNQSQIVSEDMSSVLYSAQLYFLSGSIKPLKREYSGTVRDKFTIGRLNKASWSDSLRNIRLTEKNWKIVRRRNEYFNCRRDNEISRVRNSEERISSLNVPIQAAVDTLNDPYVRSLKNMPMQDTRRRHMSSRVLEIEKKPETLELIRTAGANDVHYTWHVRMTFWNSIRVLLNVVLGLGAILLACDAQEKKCAPSVFGDCWRFMASTSF